jgi:hypothetical protein
VRFEVITLRGKRLGHLADLLLDPEGRRIVAYLVAPPTAAADSASPPAPAQLSADTFGNLPETVAGEPNSTPAASHEPASAPLLVVASDEGVRVGRDLIIVAGHVHDDTTTSHMDTPRHSPFMVSRSLGADGSHAHEPAPPAPDRLIYDPDAPTEQVRG